MLGDRGFCMVPHRCMDQLGQLDVQGGSRKKARHGVGNIAENYAANSRSAARNGLWRDDDVASPSPFMCRRSQMLDFLWPCHASDDVSPLTPMGMDRFTTLPQGKKRASSYHSVRHDDMVVKDYFCFDGPVIGNNGDIDVDNPFPYLLENCPAYTDIDFLKNDNEDKEDSHVLDERLDFGNFEDFETMLRNSTSTNCQLRDQNGEGSSWLSSSPYTIESSEDINQSISQSSCSDLNALENASNYEANINIWSESVETTLVADKSSSFYNRVYADWFEADGIVELNNCNVINDSTISLLAQSSLDSVMHLHQDFNMAKTESNPSKSLHQSEGNRKHKNSEDSKDVSFNANDQTMQCKNKNYIPFSTSASQANLFGSKMPFLEPDSLSHQNSCSPHLGIMHCHSQQGASIGHSASIINNGQETRPPLSNVISEQYLNQCIMNNHKDEKEFSELKNQGGGDSKYEEKSKEEFGNEVACSFLPENTSTSILHDKMLSAEASLLLFQSAMSKLDIGMKLSMRDGLYRLARNAEQRRNVGDMKPSHEKNLTTGKIHVIDLSERFSRFMDLETCTNPVDRSIAHFLFYRRSPEHSSHINNFGT